MERQLGLFPTFEEVLNSFQYGVGFMRLHPQLGKVGKTFLQRKNARNCHRISPGQLIRSVSCPADSRIVARGNTKSLVYLLTA